MKNIAITDGKGGLRVLQVSDDARNIVVIDGVRYKADGTVTHEGQRFGFYRPSKTTTKSGNCPRCAGTGNFGTHGVCWDCNGSGNRRTK